MASIRLQIAFVSIFSTPVEVIVLVDQLFELRLYINNLLRWEVKLNNGDAGFLELSEETYFGGLEEHKGTAATVGSTCCPSYTVDIFPRIIRKYYK